MDERKTLDITKEEWLSSSQAAELLPAVKRRTVQSWAVKGRFPNAIQLPSGQWRIPRKDVEAILGGAVQ
ncbi:helix-turn-helix domain-containing protein [Corynebacterium amycolatum]|uniref:helix-turn-helix domain-containing protein n=1 Tax=Corynebacterium amycolatum TaxID=43765 RepID=UPI0012445145|nr:helix-turn-helix domain-containing protein [Corynebacterium amycolatum]